MLRSNRRVSATPMDEEDSEDTILDYAVPVVMSPKSPKVVLRQRSYDTGDESGSLSPVSSSATAGLSLSIKLRDDCDDMTLHTTLMSSSTCSVEHRNSNHIVPESDCDSVVGRLSDGSAQRVGGLRHSLQVN
ncbi:hypothetical protein EON65_35420 [archaeon]|nr:MAG: hypothetical protein EON65_35420 [archaeon]